MTKRIFLFFIAFFPLAGMAQTRTTDALQKKFAGAFSLFFYKNTLLMLNQTDNKEFDELVKDIEKMKFLRIDKSTGSFGPADYKKLKKDYTSEAYEEIVTSRYEGRNFDIYLKDKKSSSLGTVVLVNDSTDLYVLDILGTIDVRQASKLFSMLNGSSEISDKIKSFVDHGGKNKEGKKIKID